MPEYIHLMGFLPFPTFLFGLSSRELVQANLSPLLRPPPRFFLSSLVKLEPIRVAARRQRRAHTRPLRNMPGGGWSDRPRSGGTPAPRQRSGRRRDVGRRRRRRRQRTGHNPFTAANSILYEFQPRCPRRLGCSLQRGQRERDIPLRVFFFITLDRKYVHSIDIHVRVQAPNGGYSCSQGGMWRCGGELLEPFRTQVSFGGQTT